MKVVAIGSVLSALAFVAVGLQMGIFRGQRAPVDENSAVEEAPPPPPAKVSAKFPEDLAPAAQARPVPAAAEYKHGPVPHPLVFLRLSGAVHPWQEYVGDTWSAETVATTELVVVVGQPRKIFVNRIDYAGGAPPITRYIFELEISVIEAKTGKILANRLFRNTPRQIMHREAWETTAIGRAVSIQQVKSWVCNTSMAGFPAAHDPNPITLEVD
jgi:hypothetical protein